MVAKLTANKLEAELHPNRSQPEFERLLSRHFDTAATTTLGEGTRILYRLVPNV
jgi:hypothetical protein